MSVVDYDAELPYAYDLSFRDRFPILQVRISGTADFARHVFTDAHLDSGARLSLFDGALVTSATGLDLFDGRPMEYISAVGWGIEARLHLLHFEHEILGSFELKVGLSTVPIHRNLLGRDFFDLFQIGFREHHQILLLKRSP